MSAQVPADNPLKVPNEIDDDTCASADGMFYESVAVANPDSACYLDALDLPASGPSEDQLNR